MRLKHDPYIGTSTIEGNAYPEDAEVNIQVERDNKVISEAKRTVSKMSFVQGLRNPLKENDCVIITVSAPGFAPLTTSYSVY